MNLSSIELPEELIELLAEGFINFRGATFYKFVEERSVTEGKPYPDPVGVEAHDNNLYLLDDFPEGQEELFFAIGLKYTIELFKALKQLDGSYEIIYSHGLDGGNYTSTFCTYDPNNRCMTEELERFREEAILRVRTKIDRGEDKNK